MLRRFWMGKVRKENQRTEGGRKEGKGSNLFAIWGVTPGGREIWEESKVELILSQY